MITTLLMALAAAPLPDLDPVAVVPVGSATATRLGVDGSGHAYDGYSESYPNATYIGFKCYLESAPETKVTVMYGASTSPSSMGPIVVARDGDGVFVPPSSWFSCRDALAGGPQTPTLLTGLPSGSKHITVSPDGARICGVTTNNAYGEKVFVDCVRRGSDTVERWADSTTWDAALGIVPFEDLNPTGADRPRYSCGLTNCPEVYEGWILGQMAFAPDGEHIYMKVDRQTILPSGHGSSYSHGFYGWLLKASPGAISARLSPSLPLRDGPPDTGLAGADVTVYEATLDAMLVGPFDAEWGSDIVRLGNDGGGNVISGPRGLGGTVYFAVPLNEPGFGKLSLTNAIVAAGGASRVLRADADGLYLANGSGRFTLELDVDHLDLDGDGLDREIEDDLVTSDWLVSSDGAVTSDSIELLLGTDPLDPNDDAGSRMVPRETMALASLWELHAPALGGDMIRSFASDGPMCAAGACFDVDGDEVGHYDASVLSVVVGLDGQSLGWVDGGAAVFADLASGTETRVEGDYTAVVPLDATRGFGVDTRDASMRVDWLGGGAPETLFTLSGVQPVDLDDVVDRVRGRMKIVGYLESPGALFIGVETTWRTLVWALRPGREAVLLAKLTGADANYPDELALWADGVGYAHATRLDGLGARSYGSVFTAEAELIDTKVFDGEFFARANAAWGSVFVKVFGGGVHELVRVTEQAIPGEIYAYGTWGEGSGILRGPPRGGFIAIESFNTAMTPVTGLGVDALHHLCVAQPAIGVRELAPIATGNAPEAEIARYELPGAKDCVYDDDGGLWILVAPSLWLTEVDPSVWYRGGRGQPLVRRDDVVIGAEPLHFDQRTGFDGIPTILDRSEGCGRMTTRTGHELLVDCAAEELLWDGRPLTLNGGAVRFVGEALLAERPDGRIVATGTSLRVPIAIDIPTLRAVPYVSGNWASEQALAILPGGAPVDPWTGRSLPTLQPPPPDVGWDPPAPVEPSDPLAGEVLAAPDEGCAGGSGGGWVLFVLVMIMRRLSARPPSGRPLHVEVEQDRCLGQCDSV